MTISVFSVIMSIVCASVILFAASFLISHAKRVRWGLLMLIIILGFVRLAFPVEISAMKEIRSWWLYPTLRRFAQFEITHGVTIAKVSGLIWIIGIGVLLFRFILMILLLRHRIKKSVPVPKDDPLRVSLEKVVSSLGYRRYVRIAVTKDFTTAVSVGFFRPIILIPEDMLAYSEMEMRGVIKHELTHYLRGDVGKQWVLSTVRLLFWWNPVVHYLKHSVEEMLELECDERACRGMAEEERLAYLEAIRKVLDGKSSKNMELGMGYGKCHAGKFMQRRFQAVLEPMPKHSSGVTYFWACLSILLFLISYSFVLQPAGMPKISDTDETEIRRTPKSEKQTEEFLIKLSDGSYLYVSDMVEQDRISESELQDPPYNGLPIYEKTP